MTEATANLSLPILQPSQAQKHVTHNEALAILDALVQLAVISATTTATPPSPMDGDRFIVPSGGSGAWAGQDRAIAIWTGVGWMYLTARPGWTAWVSDASQTMVFDGTDWTVLAPDLQNIDLVGVNTSADTVNRLSVASAATLLTHEGAGHHLKINKAASHETASLLFQTGWSGRAEMGIIGTDDFAIKVSADGSSFLTALSADPITGIVDFPQGASGLAVPGTGNGPLVTQAYVAAKGDNLVANSLGALQTGYNYPPSFQRDPVTTPDLPAAFVYAGYSSGRHAMTDTIPVDPNTCYRLSCLIRQEALPGDFSAFTYAERQAQSFGFLCMDADGQVIEGRHHRRFKSGGVDSLTTLTAPLAPGDTEVHVADASGWNDSDPTADSLGLILFGYRDSHGRAYDRYSRIVDQGLFQTSGVDKTNHIITLNAPLSAALGNPDDGGGIWPIGTPLANTEAGPDEKWLASAAVLDTTDEWYKITGHVAGVDRSGGDVATNFAPGTVGVRLCWHPNESLVAGGAAGFPDTGNGHRVWIAGASATTEWLGVTSRINTGAGAGSCDLYVPSPSIGSGSIALIPAATSISVLD